MFKLAWLLLVFAPLIINWKDTIKYVDESKNMYKQLRIRHFLLGLLSVISVITMTTILYDNFSVMRFGWLWSLFNNDNNTENTTETSTTTTIISGIVIIILYVFLLIIIPSLARQEEKIFREKAIDRKFSLTINKKIVKTKTIVPLLYQVGFGLAHMIMGIPLAVACSLIISGIIFYLTAKYSFIKHFNNNIKNIHYSNDKEKLIQSVKTVFNAKDYAINQSTLVHSAHNIIIVTSCIIGMITSLLV